MNNVNIEELKAKVAAAQEATRKRVQEAAEVARLEATLKLETSETLFDARVRLAANGAQTERLQALVNECAGIVTSIPIHIPKTRTNRVWSGSHRYNFGTQLDLMYQLATGILYSCQEHKQLLLSHTGLNLEVLEQLQKAFGTPSYYSRNYNSIVEARDYNFEQVQAVLEVMQSELGVVIDTSEVTRDNFEHEFVRAENTALEQFNQAKEAMEEADLVM